MTTPTTQITASTEITSEFTVSGMTCSHCAAAVTDEVLALDSVHDATVDLDSGRLVVASSAPVADAVRGAVTEAGYSVVD